MHNRQHISSRKFKCRVKTYPVPRADDKMPDKVQFCARGWFLVQAEVNLGMILKINA